MAGSIGRLRWLLCGTLLSCSLHSVPESDSRAASSAGQAGPASPSERAVDAGLREDDRPAVRLPPSAAGAKSPAGVSGAGAQPEHEMRPDVPPSAPIPGGNASYAAGANAPAMAGRSGADAGRASAGDGAAGSGAAGSGSAGGAAGSSSAANGGGSAEAGGGGSAAGSGGAAAPPPGSLQCDNELCAPLPELPEQFANRYSIENCCTRKGECGTSVNGEDCRRTPDSIPNCPDVQIVGFPLPSCCTRDRGCGVNLSLVDEGCYSYEKLIDELIDWIESPLDLPEPVACERD